MLMEGLDGRLLVSSVSDPRYALHTAALRDGRRLEVKEDIWQTAEFRQIAASRGEPVPVGPRYYVTNVTLPSGEKVNPQQATLPSVFKLDGGLVVQDYVCYTPKDN